MNTEQIALLRKTLEHITAHPEEWDQTAWGKLTPCGTSHCLAGHAVTMGSQATFMWDALGYLETVKTEDGSIHKVWEYASELLGFDEPMQPIYAPSNSLKTLWHDANNLSEGAIEVPEEFL